MTDNLIAHYPFTGTLENKIDPSKPAFGEYVLKPTTDRDGNVDMAINFSDGVTELIDLNPEFLDGATDFTVSFWVFARSGNLNPCMFSMLGNNDSALGFFCHYTAHMMVYDSSIVSFSKDQWIHYAGVRNTGDSKVYIYHDGTMVDSINVGSNVGPLGVKRFGLGNILINGSTSGG